jgi:hypothetical protein
VPVTSEAVAPTPVTPSVPAAAKAAVTPVVAVASAIANTVATVTAVVYYPQLPFKQLGPVENFERRIASVEDHHHPTAAMKHRPTITMTHRAGQIGLIAKRGANGGTRLSQ